MNNDYWEDLAKTLLGKYQNIMSEKNFKYEDYKLGYLRCYVFDTVEEKRRFKESCNLIETIFKDTNTMPKRYKSWIISVLKKYNTLTHGRDVRSKKK